MSSEKANSDLDVQLKNSFEAKINVYEALRSPTEEDLKVLEKEVEENHTKFYKEIEEKGGGRTLMEERKKILAENYRKANVAVKNFEEIRQAELKYKVAMMEYEHDKEKLEKMGVVLASDEHIEGTVAKELEEIKTIERHARAEQFIRLKDFIKGKTQGLNQKIRKHQEGKAAAMFAEYTKKDDVTLAAEASEKAKQEASAKKIALLIESLNLKLKLPPEELEKLRASKPEEAIKTYEAEINTQIKKLGESMLKEEQEIKQLEASLTEASKAVGNVADMQGQKAMLENALTEQHKEVSRQSEKNLKNLDSYKGFFGFFKKLFNREAYNTLKKEAEHMGNMLDAIFVIRKDIKNDNLQHLSQVKVDDLSENVHKALDAIQESLKNQSTRVAKISGLNDQLQGKRLAYDLHDSKAKISVLESLIGVENSENDAKFTASTAPAPSKRPE